MKGSEQAQALLRWMNQVGGKVTGPDALTLPEPKQALVQRAAKLRREKIIFGNYAWQVKQGPLGKRQAYGMWGFFHGLQGPLQGGLSFAGTVKGSDLPAAHSIATLLCIPLDAQMMVPTSQMPAALRG